MPGPSARRGLSSLFLTLVLALLLAPVAQAQPVSVIFPNLADGQTVGGKINLSVTVTAAQPIVSVEYRLNERSLAKITIAPFNYEWDTTSTAPGVYTLSAIVVDKGGNSGQAQVALTIAKPVEVAISVAQDTIHIGDQVALNATVSALIEVSRVELLVDNAVVSSDTTPPFAFTFDSAAYAVGPHTVTLRAEDALGRTGEASLTLQFNAADQTGGLRVLIIVAVIATVIAAIFVLWRTLKMTRRSYLRTARIDLHNLGNVTSRYELRADNGAGGLKFQLLLNDVALPTTGGFAPAPASTPAPVEAAVARPAPASAIYPTDGLKQSGGAFSDLLMAIGQVLPRSIGGPLIDMSSSLRQARYTADRAQSAASRLAPIGGVGRLMPARGATVKDAPATSNTSTQNAAAPSASPVWQTPSLEPDATLRLKLVVDPGRPRQTQQYTFRLTSQPIEHAGAEAQITDSVLNIEGLSLLRLYLPFFVVAGVTLAIFLIIALLLANSGVLS